jgi:hypothetical protein
LYEAVPAGRRDATCSAAIGFDEVAVVALLRSLQQAISTARGHAEVGAAVGVDGVAVVARLACLHYAVTAPRLRAVIRAAVERVGIAVITGFAELADAISATRELATTRTGIGITRVAVVTCFWRLNHAVAADRRRPAEALQAIERGGTIAGAGAWLPTLATTGCFVGLSVAVIVDQVAALFGRCSQLLAPELAVAGQFTRGASSRESRVAAVPHLRHAVVNHAVAVIVQTVADLRCSGLDSGIGVVAVGKRTAWAKACQIAIQVNAERGAHADSLGVGTGYTDASLIACAVLGGGATYHADTIPRRGNW